MLQAFRDRPWGDESEQPARPRTPTDDAARYRPPEAPERHFWPRARGDDAQLLGRAHSLQGAVGYFGPGPFSTRRNDSKRWAGMGTRQVPRPLARDSNNDSCGSCKSWPNSQRLSQWEPLPSRNAVGPFRHPVRAASALCGCGTGRTAGHPHTDVPHPHTNVPQLRSALLGKRVARASVAGLPGHLALVEKLHISFSCATLRFARFTSQLTDLVLPEFALARRGMTIARSAVQQRCIRVCEGGTWPCASSRPVRVRRSAAIAG
jgi:hypothetical protein